MNLRDIAKMTETCLDEKKIEEELFKQSKIQSNDILDQNVEDIDLEQLMEEFFHEKSIVDRHKKRSEKLNAKIKETMNFKEIDNIKCGDYEAKITIQNKSTLNEELLIEKLKELGQDDLIMTKEAANIELIEERIYNNEFNPTTLADCMEYKEVQTLKVKKKGGGAK